MYFLIVFGILFGAFTIIVAPLVKPEGYGVIPAKAGTEAAPRVKHGVYGCDREMGVVLKALVAAVGILAALGFVGTLVGYIDPGVALTSAEFRIIPLPEIGAEELGYTAEEGVKLIGLGILLKSLAAFLYLVIVVGGHLAMAIRR